jgi:hypothetical protein
MEAAEKRYEVVFDKDVNNSKMFAKHNHLVDQQQQKKDDEEESSDEEDHKNFPTEDDFDVYWRQWYERELAGKRHSKEELKIDQITESLEPKWNNLMLQLDPSIKFTKENAYYYGRWEGGHFKIPIPQLTKWERHTNLQEYVEIICNNLRPHRDGNMHNNKIINESLPFEEIIRALKTTSHQLQLAPDYWIHTMVVDVHYFSGFGICLLWGADMYYQEENSMTNSEYVWTVMKLDSPNPEKNYFPFSLRIALYKNGFNDKGVVKTQTPISKVCQPLGKLKEDIGNWFLWMLNDMNLSLDMKLCLMASFDWIPMFISPNQASPVYARMLNEHPSMSWVMSPILKSAQLYRRLAFHPKDSLKIPVKARVGLQIQLLRNIDCYAEQILAYWNLAPHTAQTDPLELLPLFANMNWYWSLASVKMFPRSDAMGVMLAHLRTDVPFHLTDAHRHPSDPYLQTVARITLAHVAAITCRMLQAYFIRPYPLHVIRNPTMLDWIPEPLDPLMFFIFQTASYLNSEALLVEFCAAIHNASLPQTKAVFLQKKLELKTWYARPNRIVNTTAYGFRYLERSIRDIRKTRKRLKITSGRIVKEYDFIVH